MKKVLALLLVLGLASMASATVIDVVGVDVGLSEGRTGTAENPLKPSDIIGLKIILNHNPYPSWPTYDGYAMDGMDLDLHVSGPGTLDVPGIYDKSGNRIGDDLKHNSDFGVWSQSGNNDGTPAGYVPLIVGNSIASMSGGVLEGLIRGEADLVWDLLFHCDDLGEVLIDLTLAGSTRIADYTDITGNNPYPEWRFAIEEELGDLVIHQVPEPMTLALLGLGGLFLRRRK